MPSVIRIPDAQRHGPSPIRDCMSPLGTQGSDNVEGILPPSGFMDGDIESSICVNCGHMPGAWLPGLPCPECGEMLI